MGRTDVETDGDLITKLFLNQSMKTLLKFDLVDSKIAKHLHYHVQCTLSLKYFILLSLSKFPRNSSRPCLS